MSTSSEASRTEVAEIMSLTSGSLSTSHNVAVITHPNFLVAVPSQFQCEPLARANKIASDLLEEATTHQLRAVAGTPTGTGDFIFLVFSVLIVVGFIVWSVTRTIGQKYCAVLLFQPFFALVLCTLTWSGKSLWKPQHVVLSRETGMLHSRRNSFIGPVAIPLSSIRFFRTTAKYTPRFTNSHVKYGVEAVTTGEEFSFAFGKSENVAIQLEDILNKTLRSFQNVTPPPPIFGNVGSDAASMTVSKKDIPDVQALSGDSSITVSEKGGYAFLKKNRRWVLEAMYITGALFIVWVFSLLLGICVGSGTIRDLFVNPFTIVGTLSYVLTFTTFLYMHITRNLWKLGGDEDKRNFIQHAFWRRKYVKVTDYQTLKLERVEAKMLYYFQDIHKRGTEQLGGKRFRLTLECDEKDHKSVDMLGALTEGEAMFLIATIGKTFPSLFDNKLCEV